MKYQHNNKKKELRKCSPLPRTLLRVVGPHDRGNSGGGRSGGCCERRAGEWHGDTELKGPIKGSVGVQPIVPCRKGVARLLTSDSPHVTLWLSVCEHLLSLSGKKYIINNHNELEGYTQSTTQLTQVFRLKTTGNYKSCHATFFAKTEVMNVL